MIIAIILFLLALYECSMTKCIIEDDILHYLQFVPAYDCI